jgi:hypothetical protein
MIIGARERTLKEEIHIIPGQSLRSFPMSKNEGDMTFFSIKPDDDWVIVRYNLMKFAQTEYDPG